MIRRSLLICALLVMGLAGIPLVSASPASAAPPPAPTSFKIVQYDAGMFEYDLTNFVEIPGTDTLLATGKSGRMTRVTVTGDGMDASDASNIILGNMPAYYQGDRGLLGISLASDYATSEHVNLLWDYCQQQPGHPVASDDQQCIPDGGLPTGRLSRMTLTGPATAPTGIDFTSEVVLMDNLPSWSPTPGASCTDSHTIGTVITAADGTLFVGNGDGSSYCGTGDTSSLSAQDIFSPRGKIFHINQDGTPVASNPFIASKIDGTNDYPIRDEYWAQRVYAYGFRNPYRFTEINTDTHTPTLLVGDVGWNTTEEIDNVSAGGNYGWPCVEGDGNGAPFPGNAACGTNLAAPIITWQHNGAQSAAVGGVISPRGWGSFGGQFLYGDYALGNLSVAGQPFGTPGTWGSITSIQRCFPNSGSLDGDVCVSDIGKPGTGPGKITRIHATGTTNAVPTVSINGGPLTGAAPLNVQFATPIDNDPDGTIASYSWNLGDGSPAIAGTGQPTGLSHVYTAPGSYTVVLTVTDNGGATASATQTVNAGKQPAHAGGDGPAEQHLLPHR